MNRPAQEPAQDRRARLIEVGLSVAASVVASAVVASWTMSETLATFKAKIDEHDRALVFKQQQISALEVRQSTSEKDQAQQAARWEEIQRRLNSIDTKLDARLR